MRLPVTRGNDEDFNLISLPVSEVLFLEYDFIDKKVWTHTRNDRYYLPGTLTYWAKALSTSGYDFMTVDRNIVVQLSKIKRLDTMLKYAYFEDQIRRDSKRVTVSNKYYKELITLNKARNLQIAMT